MKQYNPEEFTAMCKEYYPKVKPMDFKEAVEYLEKEMRIDEHSGWSIRYYGFGEHLTFWAGDGTFIDFGIAQDDKITWTKLKQILIESAMARKDFENQVDLMFKKGDA